MKLCFYKKKSPVMRNGRLRSNVLLLNPPVFVKHLANEIYRLKKNNVV